MDDCLLYVDCWVQVGHITSTLSFSLSCWPPVVAILSALRSAKTCQGLAQGSWERGGGQAGPGTRLVSPPHVARCAVTQVWVCKVTVRLRSDSSAVWLHVQWNAAGCTASVTVFMLKISPQLAFCQVFCLGKNYIGTR